MKPQDFILFDGDSSPNTAIIDIYEAMQKPVKILGADGEYKVLSYYYDEEEEQMVLDIEKTTKSKKSKKK